jgi:hypothetical protein
MKKIMIVLSLFFLSGCSIFERGNYEQNRNGFIINDGLIIKYHTNDIGEIDVFMIDNILTFFESLDYVDFDIGHLSTNTIIHNEVSVSELATCNIHRDIPIPRFIKVNDNDYYFNIRDNGYCTYDAYDFHEEGFSKTLGQSVENTSPIEPLNSTRFKDADFIVNTFEDVLYVEDVSFDSITNQWVKTTVDVLPMSYSQLGNTYEDLTQTLQQYRYLERYVLQNQSINLLKLADDYMDPSAKSIWSDETIEALGRDNDIVKYVRISSIQDILDIIHDALSGLEMFE